MNNVILHIPHSSERLPRGFFKRTLLPESETREFCREIADTKTRELFGSNNLRRVAFDWSRIFCDVEKFLDNKKEIMAQFGMGAIYTKTNKGKEFMRPTKEYVDGVIKKYYIPHHQKLDSTVKSARQKGKVILVDCHSFCKEIIMFKEKKVNLPDICIGYNEKVANPAARLAIEHFKNLGYNVKENYPYGGAMIPDYLLKKGDDGVLCFMIEINKTLYLNNKTAFETLKMQINDLYSRLKRLKLD